MQKNAHIPIFFYNFAPEIAKMTTDTAIVLSLQRHSDRAHILHTYTRSSGRVNYLVFGLSSKRKPAAQYAPLSLIEITADNRPDRPLPTLKEANFQGVHPANLTNSAYRETVALFISEVLYRTLRHPMQDEALFRFLEATVRDLYSAEDIHNVHVRFLIGLASTLGFGINEEEHPFLMRTAVSREDRQLQLHQLCEYLAEHIDNFEIPLSLDILSEVFD